MYIDNLTPQLHKAIEAIESAFSLISGLEDREEEIKKKQEKIVIERERLVEDRNLFMQQVQEQKDKLERALLLEDTAKKMKVDANEQYRKAQELRDSLIERESKCIDTEKKAKEVEELEKLMKIRLEDIEQRELLVSRDKISLRQKQSDLEYREGVVKKREAKVQALLERV